ncbi:translesion error-prone DNA polymerase V subunit UmuC [soil metagenome]
MSQYPTCVALLDCNNFFASCERMLDPSLEGVPVAVLSSNDGCLIARSEEVKELGVPMGAPWFKWKDFWNEKGVRLFSLNMQLYTETSARIMNLLIERLPKVQVYSIDEAFLDLSGMEKYFDLEKFLQQLRHDIRQQIGIPVSIGVAPSKALAKMANAIAKKKKTTYVEYLMDADVREAVLKATPVEKVWGVGRRNAVKMHDIGVQTAWDLACLNPRTVQKMRSVIEGRLVLELRGQSCLAIETPSDVKHHIGSSRSFGEKITTLENLQGAFTFLMHLATRKLMRQQSACKTIYLHVYIGKPRSPDRKTVSKSVTLPTASHYPPVLLQEVLRVLAEELYQPGYRYYKAGVVLCELSSMAELRSNLFFEQSQGKQSKVLELMTQLNRNQPKPQVEWASFKVEEGTKPWIPKCDHMSSPSATHITDDEMETARPWW